MDWINIATDKQSLKQDDRVLVYGVLGDGFDFDVYNAVYKPNCFPEWVLFSDWMEGSIGIYGVTHYMPLPSKPGE